MKSAIAGFALLSVASGSAAASPATDFGLRIVGQAPAAAETATGLSYRPLGGGSSFSLAAVARIGSDWGRVTSTHRTPQRNRLVGGARNSFHLHGRAIDIARRPGVSHAAIAAAYRAAGYRLIESLDEGDHSHFAFATGSGSGMARDRTPRSSTGGPAETHWRIVTVAGMTAR